MGTEEKARGRRRGPIPASLTASVLLPAVAAGLLTATLLDATDPTIAGGSAAALAREAEQVARADSPPLQPPIALAGGASAPPLKPLSPAPRPALPARISIPAAGIDAPIEPVRGTPAGLELPDPDRAGWFEAGPRPGEPGRTVVIGHRDAVSGPALFADLARLTHGSPVAITDRRGAVHLYTVVGGARMEKSSFPSHLVYGPSRGRSLVLITCGGPYTPGRGYRDSVLVYARAA